MDLEMSSVNYQPIKSLILTHLINPFIPPPNSPTLYATIRAWKTLAKTLTNLNKNHLLRNTPLKMLAILDNSEIPSTWQESNLKTVGDIFNGKDFINFLDIKIKHKLPDSDFKALIKFREILKTKLLFTNPLSEITCMLFCNPTKMSLWCKNIYNYFNNDLTFHKSKYMLDWEKDLDLLNLIERCPLYVGGIATSEVLYSTFSGVVPRLKSLWENNSSLITQITNSAIQISSSSDAKVFPIYEDDDDMIIFRHNVINAKPAFRPNRFPTEISKWPKLDTILEEDKREEEDGDIIEDEKEQDHDEESIFRHIVINVRPAHRSNRFEDSKWPELGAILEEDETEEEDGEIISNRFEDSKWPELGAILEEETEEEDEDIIPDRCETDIFKWYTLDNVSEEDEEIKNEEENGDIIEEREDQQENSETEEKEQTSRVEEIVEEREDQQESSETEEKEQTSRAEEIVRPRGWFRRWMKNIRNKRTTKEKFLSRFFSFFCCSCKTVY
ncbi:uncharacterized protein LOC142297308 [Anomaloglossus baeobatrachus]|uniref:uncharacterized protein LOC142297308 n=1 Tax=Anomaloglossus baeobatrachus TaxID=238106 RepID=UPI003F4FA35F